MIHSPPYALLVARINHDVVTIVSEELIQVDVQGIYHVVLFCYQGNSRIRVTVCDGTARIRIVKPSKCDVLSVTYFMYIAASDALVR